MKTSNAYSYLLAAILLFTALQAKGFTTQDSTVIAHDVVIFLNGDRLTGTVISETEASINFITEFGVSIFIPKGRLREIQRAQSGGNNIKATKQSFSPSPENSVIQNSSGEVVINNPGGNTKVAAPAAPSKEDITNVKWLISLEPQGNLSTGLQRQRVLEGKLLINRAQNLEADNWHSQVTRLVLGASNTLTERPGVTPTRIHVYDGSFSHQIKLTKYISAFGIAEAYHNSLLRLYLQQSYGGGLAASKRFDSGRHTIELLGDVRYFGQHFDQPTATVTFTGVRIGEGYTLRLMKIGKGFVEVFEKINYIRPINLNNAWQIRGTAGIDVPLSDRFAATFRFTDDYFQNLPNGRKNYSRSTLGIKFLLTHP